MEPSRSAKRIRHMKTTITFVTLAASALALLAIVGPGTASAAEKPWGEAFCGQAIVGSGPASFPTATAGRARVRKHPLRGMVRGYPPGLVTKMPIMIRGHSPVTVTVPSRLRKRVFLLYGWVPNRKGRPGRGFSDTVGVSKITFRPCATKPRTVWPGGIRVIGRAPVKLRVRVGEQGRSQTLWLGRPRVFRG